MKPSIAIVGAYGATGKEVLKGLATEDVALTVVGRRALELQKLTADFDRPLDTAVADLDDQEALGRAFAGADVVVNCAGPMARVREKVAVAALKAGVHYVDPGGSSHLHDLLLPYASSFKERGLAAVISSGWISGISEILPKYLLQLQKANDVNVDRLEVVYGDNNIWSETATQDVINHLREVDPVEHLGYLRDGKRKKANLLTMWNSAGMPAPIGRRMTVRRLSREFVTSFQDAGVQMVSSSLSLLSLGTLFLFLRLRHSKPDQDAACIEAVNRARLRDQQKFNTPSFVYARTSGLQNGQRVIRSGLALAENHYQATGSSAAASALMLAQNISGRRGLLYAGEFADLEPFLGLYRSWGNQVQVEGDPLVTRARVSSAK